MADQLMTTEEFAQSIKAKYPDYADVPNAELAAKMLDKYPEYRERIKPDVKADTKKEEPFVPSTATEFASRMGDAAVDVPIGAAKNLGRAVQMIPGVAAATDKLFSLPAGASKQAMQPTNATQTAGGYVGDAALIAATGGAEAGGPMISRAAGYVSNPTIAGRAAAFSGDTMTALRSQLATGPVTPDKVAKLIVTYGKDAVKLGLVGLGGAAGYEAWRAVRHLF